jgi:hypothetical protein
MTLDLTKPLFLNDGTPVTLKYQGKKVITVEVPRGHPLCHEDAGDTRSFNRLDGTRNNIGAMEPLNYWLSNEPNPKPKPKPAVDEFCKIFIGTVKGVSLRLHDDDIPQFDADEHADDALMAERILIWTGCEMVTIERKTRTTVRKS